METPESDAPVVLRVLRTGNYTTAGLAALLEIRVEVMARYLADLEVRGLIARSGLWRGHWKITSLGRAKSAQAVPAAQDHLREFVSIVEDGRATLDAKHVRFQRLWEIVLEIAPHLARVRGADLLRGDTLSCIVQFQRSPSSSLALRLGDVALNFAPGVGWFISTRLTEARLSFAVLHHANRQLLVETARAMAQKALEREACRR